MILRKYMSLLGVGAAQIDLILPKITYKRGEHINAHFLIRGGTVEQQIKGINCDLVMTHQITGEEKVIDTITILTSALIGTEQQNTSVFRFKIPEDIPTSSKEYSYRFKTKLIFNKGVESKDLDIIQIV